MSEKWTPAPWSIKSSGPQNQGEWHWWTIEGQHGCITAITAIAQRGIVDMEGNKANAHLIAASPAMAEALELVIGSLKFDRNDEVSKEVIRRINAALSLARGEAK